MNNIDRVTLKYLKKDIEELTPLLYKFKEQQNLKEANQDVIMYKIKTINKTIKQINKTITILLLTTIINSITILIGALK